MAADYAWDTDHFIVCNGTVGSPRGSAALNDWAQGQGGAPAAAITEVAEDRMYYLTADIEIGNGSDSTYYTMLDEDMLFAAGKKLAIKAQAVLQMGEKSGDWGIKGSMIRFKYDSNFSMVEANGTLKVYDSRITNLTEAAIKVLFYGTVEMKNYTLSGFSSDDVRWSFASSTADLQRGYMNNSRSGLEVNVTLDTIDSVHCHACKNSIYALADSLVSNVLMTGSVSADVATWGANTDVVVRNPVTPIGTPIIGQGGTVKESYPCNIHVVDKDDADLAGVTVTCKDKDGNTEFSVVTAGNGTITQQWVDYKTRTGTDETLVTHSPHTFAFSKTGYRTLTRGGHTVDHPIVWEFKFFTAVTTGDETTKALFEAIYNRFGATVLVDKLTELYNTEADDGADCPYGVCSLPSNVPDGEFEVNWEDYLIQFTLYSEEPLATEVCDAYSALKATFDEHDLFIAGAETISLERESANLIRVEKVWQYAITYRLLIEKG